MCRLRLLAIVTATCAAAVQAQSTPPRPPLPGAPTGITAFVDVGVVPMDTERVLPNQTVLVRDGWVTALGPSNKIQVPTGAARIDGRGKYLMPGLADMHLHLFNAGRDSAGPERRLFLLLANGVTTIRNMDYFNRADGEQALQLRARAAAGELWSPRIYTSGKLGPLTGGDPKDAARGVTAYKAAGYDFIKIYTQDLEPFDSIAAAARRIGIPFSGHVPGRMTIEHALAAGFGSVEHFTAYFPFGEPRDTSRTRLRALAEATRRAGVWNCPTLAIHAALGRNTRGWNEFVKALQDAGAGLLLGSDVPLEPWIAQRYSPGLATHLELQALAAAGLTPYQALAAATRNPAVFLGRQHESGTIAVGKQADLVLLRGNPLTDVRYTMHPEGVMLGGRWLPRAELDRRLAALPGPPARDWREASQQFYWMRVVNEASWFVPAAAARLKLTDTQRAAHASFAAEATRDAQRQALIDSLGASTDSVAGHRRVFQFVARQLSEFRLTLTAEQRAAFDPQAREWMQRRAAEGYPIKIAGMTE